jgi:hypothetical protein
VQEYTALQKEMLFQDALFSLQATARFYNSFDASTRFMGKLSQDLIAKRVGFNVAETLVGASNQQVIDFVTEKRVKGIPVCTKPIAQKYLRMDGELFTRYTEMLDDSVDLNVEDFQACPIIIQEYVEKAYELRVTVADTKLMAVRIDSQQSTDGTKVD